MESAQLRDRGTWAPVSPYDVFVAQRTARPWVLFDVGGVLGLVDDDAWPQELWERWATRMGSTSTDLIRCCRKARLPPTDVEAGTESEYWRAMGRPLGIGSEDAERIRAEFWDSYCGRANEEFIEYARTLQPRAGVAILSNSADGAREQEERRSGFSAVFDPICYSHELGASKPDPRAYELAPRQMGARPEQVLFIDDHVEFLDGAAACGLNTILPESNAGTVAAVKEFLSA